MTVYTVTSSADSGAGSLRQAITDVNQDFSPDTIDFAIGTGSQRIILQSALPAIINQVTIDGSSQPGYSTTAKIPQIVIDGAAVHNPSQNGLTIEAANSIVDGLAIINSGAAGIYVQTDGVGLYSNEIGIDPIRSVVAPNGSSGISLFLASNNTIGAAGAGNLIAGNNSSGITASFLSSNNLIQGNAIGTTFAQGGGGSGISLSPQNIGNGGDGITLTAVSGTTIGGTTAGSGNVISGNSGRGVNVQKGSGTLIQGNIIGLDAAGSIVTANKLDGIFFDNSTSNTVGGTAIGSGNVISGNLQNGIDQGVGSGLLVQGNKIGSDITGELSRGNGADGVNVEGSPNNTIGGPTASAGNLISGNSNDGVLLNLAATTNNVIQGNLIGVDQAGTNFLSNAGNGVEISSSSKNTILNNEISGNNFAGISIDQGASGNSVRGNLIGTDSRGDQLANLSDGVFIIQSPNNTVGGTTPAARNVLAANQGYGLSFRGPQSTGNLAEGNYIGLDATGEKNVGNLLGGIFIQNAPSNTIGGAVAGSTNVISTNGIGLNIQTVATSDLGQEATIFQGGFANNNVVQKNLIGTDATGSLGFGNNQEGILILGGSNNLIGGPSTGDGNVISANLSNGIDVEAEPSVAPTTGNTIQGNLIGLDASGTVQLGNGRDGIHLFAAPDTLIGGSTNGAGNVISGNTNGIEIFSPSAGFNPPLGDLVQGNIIGLGADGQQLNPTGLNGFSLRNTGDGIVLEQGASGVTIGGTTPGTGNVISGNGSSGVRFASSASDDLVQGNIIGLAADGLTSRGNNQSGVFIGEASTGNTIGGTAQGAGNVISGNSIGVTITNPGTSTNLVQGNLIGLARDGLTSVGNLSYGVILLNGVTGNTIGGDSAGARNVISANGQGIGIVGPGSTGNLISGDYIGLDASGTSPRGNLQIGVFLNQAADNTIGGTSSGAGNVISGNSGSGIQIFGPTSTANLVVGNLIGLDATGSVTSSPTGQSLGNSNFGIQIEDAGSNTVGGSTAGSRNVVSGNRQGGIDITGSSAAGNVVQGNDVGLDASGSISRGNLADGIQVYNAPANVIGGISAATRNVVSGNVGSGIEIDGPGSFFDEVLGNFIGTDASGEVARANALSGIFVNGAPGVTIGGTIAGLGNLISGNAANGIQITGQASYSTIVLGNSIGVDERGGSAIANGNDGVILDGTSGVTVGGTTPGSTNVISGNAGNGVEFGGTNSHNDVLQGNLIGTDLTGSSPIPNATGVLVNGSFANQIGGTTPFSGNLISGNSGPGVHVFGVGSYLNSIEGNRIGTVLMGNAPLANQAGVFLDSSASNLVGGNILSGNSAAGVIIEGLTATSNLVQGNLIGLDATGSRAIGSETPQQSGVLIDNAPSNVIGGTTPATRNVISGNLAGVVITGFDSTGNLVLGNLIGVNASGSRAVSNGTGVYINGSASNTIGGSVAGSANVVSGNTDTGVYLYGTLTTNNVVAGNLIGTDATGSSAIPNSSGIFLELATQNIIGGTTAAAGNLVSGNTVAGIYLFDQAINNTIERNRIGITETGKKLGNLQYGILLYNAATNTAPTSGAGANTIANSGIGNFREFTGAVPTTTTTTKSSKSTVKSKSVSIKSVHPTGPTRVNRRGSASGSASSHRTGS